MEALLVLGPLFGAIIAGFFHRQIGEWASMLVTTGFVLICAMFSLILWIQVGFGDKEAYDIILAPWISVGDFQSDWAVRVDPLSTTMMFVVTSVSSLVHIYSIGYMDHDPHKGRFFSYLSLFTFAMLMLVTAKDFLQMFFGWEGVGLASYLLVGFWYQKDSANDAAIKAFVTNRVGDVGFALGIIACYLTFRSIEFDQVFAQVAAHSGDVVSYFGVSAPVLEIIGVLLFVGAMGKSAQFILHVWLPDAMEGPTPVSALIHAATMVTAGVFLVCRCSPIYDQTLFASGMIAVVGSITALYAASVALAQNDIKKVIAYSTCSQLGYMFFAAGVGAYNAAMFHLVTHAFFKAMLFLGAGAVIHGVHDEQDMRKMGGLGNIMPLTYAMMLIGTLAITGVGIPHTKFGFAGFISKDAIIESAYAFAESSGAFFGYIAFIAGVLAAMMTAFYSWRLIFMTFHGTYRGEVHRGHEPHESGWLLLGPLVPLAIGAIFAGSLLYGSMMGKHSSSYWAGSLVLAHHDSKAHHDQVEHHTDEHDFGTKDEGHSEPSQDQHEDRVATGEAMPTSDYANDLRVEFPNRGTARVVEAVDSDHQSPASYDGRQSSSGSYGHHDLPEWVIWSPTFAMLTGLALAIIFYLLYPSIPKRMGEQNGFVLRFLQNRWYIDQLYHILFVKGAAFIGQILWRVGDMKLIDGLGPNGVAALTKGFSQKASRFQSGYLYHYAFVMLIAVAILIALGLWAGGAS